MKPYYQDSKVTIYHGDSAQILPDIGRFDLLLTDPPYGIGRDGSLATTSSHGGRKAYDFKGWDESVPSKEIFDLIISAADQHIIWGGNYFTHALPASMKWLVWDKGQRICQSDGELAWTSLKGALRIFTLNRVALMMDGAQHPTQKPEQLISWCISQAESVKSIFDPFAGSGTTGRVAKNMGIPCTLIEREESYCEIAAKRMAQEVFDFK